MIFLSQLINLPIIDNRQEEIGKLKDVVVKSKEGQYPEVSGIIFKIKKKEAIIPYQYIENLGYGEITLKKSDCWKFDTEHHNSGFFLARDILDQQIFDVGGIRVVRVNDLELAKLKEKFYLVGIDVSNRALLRRLGLVHLPLLKKMRSQLINWNNVSLVKGDVGSLQLKTSKEKLQKLHPADIANLLENLNFQESTKLVQSLDEETAAEILEEVEPEYKDTLLEHINPKHLAEIVEEMPPDEAADVIQDLSEYKRHQVYRRLGTRKARSLHQLTSYQEDVAGGLMNSEFLTVQKEQTVGQAISKIRKKSSDYKSLYHIFVTDHEKKLEGIVSIRTLLVASNREKIAHIMSPVAQTVHENTSAHEVATIMTKYNLLSVAVTDEEKILKGIIAVDDILRFLIPDA